MKIAVDASDLVSDRINGTVVYVRSVLPLVVRKLAAMGHEVRAAVQEKTAEADVPWAVALGKGRMWTQRRFLPWVFRERPDIVYCMAQTVPLLLPNSARLVATIHDIDFLKFPEMYETQNRLLLKLYSAAAAKRSKKLIAVSEFTKREVVQKYRVPAEKIAVVPHGYDPAVFNPELRRRPEAVKEDLKRRFGIHGRFVLFVGALQPKKNLPRLLAAYAMIAKETGVKLAIASGDGWKKEEFEAALRANPARGSIVVLKKVSTEGLRYLYAGADAFILPSITEGFGMPVLEAMAAGTPVLASRGTVLEEVAGGAALLFDPQSEKEMAEKMRAVLSSKDLGRELEERSLARAKSFAWEKTAEKIAAIIAAA